MALTFTGANAKSDYSPAGHVPLASADDDTAHWLHGIATSTVYGGAANSRRR